MARHLSFPVIAILALLSACGGTGSDRPVEIAVIGTSPALFQKGVRLSSAGQQLRAATVDGLVGFDAAGEVTPALAERWIVTDDGRSYIFRLRDGTWPDGSELDGPSVRNALRNALRSLRGTSMGLDLAKISEVRAMAGRVVEIRLQSPMPDFLRLLAQPELGLFHKGKGAGLMSLERRDDLALLTPVPPEDRGQPAERGWKKQVRQLRVRAMGPAEATSLFDEGEVDLVLDGRVEQLPLADTGPLSRGTVRLDRVTGLFGLRILSDRGFLADPSRREAVAMAIDREGLVAPFNIGGWQATTRIVAPGLAGDLGTIGERWGELSIEQRQAEAARRVAAWRAENGGKEVRLVLALPEGPGADVLFSLLRRDLARAGMIAVRASPGGKADMALFDRVARYGDARWFLNQFHCGIRKGLCSRVADALVADSLDAPDVAAGNATLAEAEAELTAANIFIPFGAPLRWSLVRGSVKGFESNRWGIHPLASFAFPIR